MRIKKASESVNVEPDTNWNFPFKSDRDPTGGSLRRAIRVQAEKLPAELVQLLHNLDNQNAKEDGLQPEVGRGTDKRFVQGGKESHFSESEDVGRSFGGDHKREARNKPNKGQRAKGDR